MVDFDARLIEEVQPTVPAFPLLPGKQPAQLVPGQWLLLAQASRPVQEVAVIRTRGALDQDMSSNRNGIVLLQLDAFCRRKAPVVLLAGVPVPPGPPGGCFPGVTAGGPAPQEGEQLVVAVREHPLGDDIPVIVRPPADTGVELTD